MLTPSEAFDEHKEEIRICLQDAIRAYQRLARLDLGELNRENALDMYQEFSTVEEMFEGVGGILDLLRHYFQQAGEAFTEHLSEVGFAGEVTPVVLEPTDE